MIFISVIFSVKERAGIHFSKPIRVCEITWKTFLCDSDGNGSSNDGAKIYICDWIYFILFYFK